MYVTEFYATVAAPQSVQRLRHEIVGIWYSVNFDSHFIKPRKNPHVNCGEIGSANEELGEI